MNNRYAGLLVLSVVMTALPGCYESTGGPSYEPGVYKGSSDPLVYKQKAGRLEEDLNQRVGKAYWDR